MNHRRYTDVQLKQAVEHSYTMRAVLQELGLKPVGGNYETVAKRIRELGLDTSHFLGSGHLRGKSHNYTTRPPKSILVHLKLENTWRLRNRLIRENVKTHQCERCASKEWMGHPIPLELHHKDGDRTNHRLENLELLCPNCHAATDNYRGSKKKV
jgi:hypothetical protein